MAYTARLLIHEVVTIQPSSTVAEAARLLKASNIGAVIVSEGGAKPLGIFTERDLCRRVVAEGIPHDVLINVNFPDCAPNEVKRIAVTAQGRRRQERLQIDERRDGRGNPYYWITYARLSVIKAAPDGTDLAALDEHCIAVTPLKLDMTDEPYMTKLSGLFE